MLGLNTPIYICTTMGWRQLSEASSPSFIFDPANKPVKAVIANTGTMAKIILGYNVVFITEDRQKSTEMVLHEDQIVVLSNYRICKAKDLKQGMKLMQHKKHLKQNNQWIVYNISPTMKPIEYVKVYVDGHFYYVNGAYIILGDDNYDPVRRN